MQAAQLYGGIIDTFGETNAAANELGEKSPR
jgi:hypothetical protein